MSTPIHPARSRLLMQLSRPESDLDLIDAALCIAWEDQGRPIVEPALARLDQLAAGARRAVPPHAPPRAAVAALNRFLFDEQGFHGNTSDYQDPRNSFLDQVLERRTGLPITLSLLYSELALRLGLPIFGVGMPRHFIVRHLSPYDDFFIDPFSGGQIWSRKECEGYLAPLGPLNQEAIESFLRPATKREILARMLRNLKSTYAQRGSLLAALTAVERILLIEPAEPAELRDRGVLRAQLGMLTPALNDFERYVSLVPRTPDLPSVRRQAQAVARLLGRRN